MRTMAVKTKGDSLKRSSTHLEMAADAKTTMGWMAITATTMLMSLLWCCCCGSLTCTRKSNTG